MTAQAIRERVTVDEKALRDFCAKWRISELQLFGSVLREDFGADSDVDLLVRFEPDAPIGLLEHLEAEDELAALLGRKVDLVSRRAVEQSRNPIRRSAILGSAVPFYVSG